MALLQSLLPFTISKTKYSEKPITYISLATSKENYTVYTNEKHGFIMTASKNKIINVDVIFEPLNSWQEFINFPYPAEIEDLKQRAIDLLLNKYNNLQPQGKEVASNLKGTLSSFNENHLTPNEIEQEEIISIISNEKKTKSEILQRLLNLTATEPEVVFINSKAFKRDNKTIAEIKYLREFACQICGTSIKTRDSKLYIEAAHIKPKFLKGAETLDNIILLCPNHHKEFDLGERKIFQHTKERVCFSLNGKQYSINLLPELN